MSDFKNLGIDKNIINSISELGFKTPTSIQDKAIPLVLNSKTDLVALAQTRQFIDN